MLSKPIKTEQCVVCYGATPRPRVIEMCGTSFSLASKPSMLAAAQHPHLVKHSISLVVESFFEKSNFEKIDCYTF